MKRFHRSRLAKILVALMLLVSAITIPLSVGAVHSHASNSTTKSINKKEGTSSPLHFTTGIQSTCIPSCGNGNLQYGQFGKGPVQLQPKAYLIFWGPYWTTTTGKAVTTVVKNYFNDVSGTKFENILTQYYMINSNSSYSYISNQLQFVNNLTHVWTDTKTPPSDNACGSSIKTIEDSSIQHEVTTAINSKGWPKNDMNTTYFVYTAPGYAWHALGVCTNKSCAYHLGTVNGSAISPPFYAEMAYPGTPNTASCSSVPNQKSAGDPLVNASSHEQFETITDPELTSWNDPTLGTGRGVGEIGDKCAGNFTMGQTQLKNGGVFELQGEYSNATSKCVNAFNPVNTSADIAPPCMLSAYSLRCAITQANTDGNGDTILFDIPFSDPGCQLTTLNVFTCALSPTSSLPDLTASNTVINGYSQPGAQPNTLSLGNGDNAILTILLDGSSGAGGLALSQNASNDIIEGLQITHFTYGILLGANTVTNNTISGNFIGTNGIEALGNGVGIYVAAGSSNNTIGGQTPTAINLISGNAGEGILIGLGAGNIVEGNYIGTDIHGNTAIKKDMGTSVHVPFNSLPNSTGVYVFAQASNNTIGGTKPASANVIAYNNYGVVADNSSNTNIDGNTIKTNFIGVFVENGEMGDSIVKNTISNNGDAGILVGNSSTDNVHASISHNSIFNNGGLGIDIYPADTVNCNTSIANGPNDYLPCPIIASANTTQVSGTATPGSIVEVYSASNEIDDQGYGEGFGFLGNVTADGSGNWSISLTLPAGEEITATAIYQALDSPFVDTSEFAANVAIS